jgi:sec-independent protein translocase protein TatA
LQIRSIWVFVERIVAMPDIGPVELIIILVIVVMLFGVGKLPEVFGSVGKGLKEFRHAMKDDTSDTPAPLPVATQPVAAQPVAPQPAPQIEAQPAPVEVAAPVSEVKAPESTNSQVQAPLS